jgi:uncharacterized membrane protein
MSKTRLEAFSDGVIAILITILVLDLKTPHGSDLHSLRMLAPQFLAYLLSFVYLGIYWNNHHHLLHLAHRIDGRVMWANLHLLFWLSLVPFGTGWLGEHGREAVPTAFYGVVLLAAGCAYWVLELVLIAGEGPEGQLAKALGPELKARVSLLLYAAAVGLAFVSPITSDAIYAVVALMWLVPDRRIERHLTTPG